VCNKNLTLLATSFHCNFTTQPNPTHPTPWTDQPTSNSDLPIHRPTYRDGVQSVSQSINQSLFACKRAKHVLIQQKLGIQRVQTCTR